MVCMDFFFLSISFNMEVFRIGRNTECKHSVCFLFSLYCEFQAVFPWEISFHFHCKRNIMDLNFCFIGNIQIYVNLILFPEVNILSKGSKGSGNIRRTTGNSEPFLTHRFDVLFGSSGDAVSRPYFQRIHIEETLSVHGNSG